ncbi:hypothetical protein GCM10017673_11460 [Streptosporangium violaceochromogenes]|nr:hypothetical protein GCM10017673_11460 [Streptosporangium violaceochromogenes]
MGLELYEGGDAEGAERALDALEQLASLITALEDMGPWSAGPRGSVSAGPATPEITPRRRPKRRPRGFPGGRRTFGGSG